MLITDDVFACYRAWHRNAVAYAFLGCDEEIVIVLSSMNITPGNLVVSPSSGCVAALELLTHCCQASRFLQEAERLELVQLLRRRSLLYVAGNGTCEDVEESPASVNVPVNQASVVECLGAELHSSSCWWGLGDIVRHMLKTPRLFFGDFTLFRYRCAAVAVTGAADDNDALPGVSGSGVATGDARNAAKMLLPRGSPPSFMCDSLLPPVVDWLMARVAQSSGALSSGTPMDLLRVIFALKRSRESENAKDSVLPEMDTHDLVPAIGLLMTLFGYTVADSPRRGTLNDVDVEDMWLQLGADISCHFCGERPRLMVDEVPMVMGESAEEKGKRGKEEKNSEKEQQLTDIPALQADSEVTSASMGGTQVQSMAPTDLQAQKGSEEAPAKSDVALPQPSRFRYTILLSEHGGCSGHHKQCPWNALFLLPVLADAVSSTSPREMEFDIGDGVGGDGAMLRLRFTLPEVTKLMECWRRSRYVESVWMEAYTRYPLPSALRSVLPLPIEQGMERFLQELESRPTSEGKAKAEKKEREEEKRLMWSQQLTPLFDNHSFWEGYFHVASFVKSAAAAATATATAAAATDAPASRGPLDGGVGEHWKAVYDAGRRCLLGAPDAKAGGTTEAATRKFEELFQRSLQQDASGNVALPPSDGVMDRLFQMLADGLTAVSQQCRVSVEERLKVAELPAQDQKRVQLFLDASSKVIEDASREAPPQRPSQSKQQAPKPSNNSSGQGRPAARHHPQHQHQHQHHHHHHHQHHHHHHHHQQSRLLQPYPEQFHQSNALQSEGILPLPGGSGGLLPARGPVLQKQQHQHNKQQQVFQSAPHSLPFGGHGQSPVMGVDGAGVLDDTYMQRPSVMGQRRPQAGKFPPERKGGRGGSYRGGGGRGGRGGGGGSFKG